MPNRVTVSAGLVVLAALGAGALYRHQQAPPSCTSALATDKVYDVLHAKFQLNSIFLNDIRTLSGGYFAHQTECAAEVATIRGNQDVSTLPWRAVHYTVTHRNGSPDFTVTATLGGPTPFVRQKLSWWESTFSIP